MTKGLTNGGPAGPQVGQVGEDALVRRIVGRFGRLPPFVRVGPGDDAAVLDLAGPVVASTDTLVEGRDFRRDWSGGADVGVKVAAQNFADLAAMGARPVALLVALAAPGSLPAAFADDLAAGLDDECGRAGACVVGGDVSDADQVVVTGTALGVLPGPCVLRSGARPGDLVALAGSTGPSAAGLALLLAGFGVPGFPGGGPGGPGAGRAGDPALDRLLAAHRAPRPPYPAGPAAAAAGATALIDVSDGLVRDAGRVASASGVTLDLDLAGLLGAAGDAGQDLGVAAELLGDPSLVPRWVLGGGEDHALLACFAPGTSVPPQFREVGRVREASAGGRPDGSAEPGVLVDGRPWRGDPGWRHWG